MRKNKNKIFRILFVKIYHQIQIHFGPKLLSIEYQQIRIIPTKKLNLKKIQNIIIVKFLNFTYINSISQPFIFYQWCNLFPIFIKDLTNMPLPNKLQSWRTIIKNYKNGVSLLKVKKYSSALAFFKANLHFDPNDPIANFLLSYCLQKQGNINLARSFNQKAWNTNGCLGLLSIYQQVFLVQYIEQFINENQMLDRKISYEINDNNFLEIIYQKFNKKMNFYHSTYLFQICDSLVSQQQCCPSYYSYSGYTYYEAGQYQIAIKRFKIAIQKQSNQYRHYNNLAILTYANGQVEEGINLVLKALQLNPGQPRCYYILSFCYLKLKDYEKALNNIKLSLQKKPKTLFYQIKYFLILYLGFLQDHANYFEQIRHIKSMIDNDIDEDNVLLNEFYKPFVGRVIQLLYIYFFPRQNFVARTPTMTNFILLFDDFLCMGSVHKFHIMKKMKKMMLTEIVLDEADRQQQKLLKEEEISINKKGIKIQ